ncbi:MAG: hypothetical protein C0412_17715, partial [Flavobacterium sp.]|nr:hypothetical protein [Flavobacterium sp.]
MFNKVLIANRGEVVLRVMNTCKKIGISPIVIYSDVDKESLPVKCIKKYSGETYHLESNSYLDIENVLDIAEKSKAEAIHPGYGFLAQNISFAEKCKKHGLAFIGPSIDNFEKLNTKLAFRNTAKELGLNVVPGTFEAIKYEEAEEIAERFDYPVIVKANEGGGGRGMRIINNANEIESALNLVQLEAKNSFNNYSFYIEKFLKNTRHIEFQVLGDGKKVVCLGERECSIQRKHQKLIEETPASILSEDIRKSIGKKVVDFLTKINYRSAGTVEFLRDLEGNFYALEMNGRLQVEHPITEMVTGMDIVEEQIRIAAGEGLRYSQTDIKSNGHAIDFRINAEDPGNFNPSPGKIINFKPPEGSNIRCDTALYSGYTIPIDYDNLIAKIAVHGKNRDETIDLGKKALNGIIIEGVKTTIPRHKEILNSELFKTGNITTNFIEEYEKYQVLFESIQAPR